MNERQIPSFTFIGLPNEGKTTIASTLAGNGKLSISDKPGETTHKEEHVVLSVTKAPLLALFDTPGFQNVGELIEWFQEHDSPKEANPAKAFLAVPHHHKKFPHDCEVLETIAEGSMPILVVDSSRPVSEFDQLVAKLLGLCKVARIGLLNPKEGKGEYAEDRRSALGREIPIWRHFNPFTEGPSQRLDFIDSLRGHKADWDDGIKLAVRELRQSYQGNFEGVAEEIVKSLKRACQEKVQIAVTSKGEETAKKVASSKLEKKISKIEKDCRKTVLEAFAHNPDNWQSPTEFDIDLFHKKTWQLFGLSKKTVVVTSFLTGAATGTLIDIATGGGTMGIGALLGGAIGGGGAILLADKAADLKVLGNKAGGRSVQAQVERRSKFSSILLDRTTAFALDVAKRPHGNQTSHTEVTAVSSLCKRLEEQRKRKATRFQALVELWHREKRGSKVDEAEAWLREEIVSYLESEIFPQDSPTNSEET